MENQDTFSEIDREETGAIAHPGTLSVPLPCIAIVGVGMIGGSLGMAVRKRGLANRVVGVDLDDEILNKARSLGAIDDGLTELDAIADADLVVFAAPVGGVPALMERAAPFVESAAIVTDVGSVKTAIVEAGEKLFGRCFVGGHPMAGSEASGVTAANPDLFEGAPWILTNTHGMLRKDETARRLYEIVSALGARPVILDPVLHDRLVALVSHLPHALSFAYTDALTSNASAAAAISIAGPSYHDIARISRSSPELWADILFANRAELLRAIREFESSMDLLRGALEVGNRESLLQRLRDSKTSI